MFCPAGNAPADLWRSTCAPRGVAAGPERTDDELAADDVNGELLALIDVAAWSRLRPAGLDLAVLVAAEDGGVAAVSALIGETGRRQGKSC